MPSSRIVLYCTDRGQHPRCSLGSIRLVGQMLVFLPDENTRRTSDAGSLSETRTRADGGITFVIRCNRCVNARGAVREAVYRDDKVMPMLAGGLTELNISR